MRSLVVLGVLVVAGCSAPALVPVPREDRLVMTGAQRNRFIYDCRAANTSVPISSQLAMCECVANGLETYLTKQEWDRMVFTTMQSQPATQSTLFSEAPKGLAVRRECSRYTGT